MNFTDKAAYMTLEEYEALPDEDPSPQYEEQFSTWKGETRMAHLYPPETKFVYRRDLPPLPCRATGCNCYVGGPPVYVRPVVFTDNDMEGIGR